jgi:hypothetical protein
MTIRAALAPATALVSAAVYAAPAQAVSAEPPRTEVVEQPFYVDSGDRCARGSAEGVLIWRPLLNPNRADVVGEVVDDSTNPACGDDGRYTVVTFTPYSYESDAAEWRQVDNGTLEYKMPVDGNSTEAYIEQMIIQVCRVSRLPGPPPYCGTARVYPSPL